MSEDLKAYNLFHDFCMSQMAVIYGIADGLDDHHNNARRRLKDQADIWYKEAEFWRNLAEKITSSEQQQPG